MITVVVIAAAGALLLIAAMLLFNRLVRLRNEVNAGWSNIDVQLKRRNDLIPNIVETVKGYAAHERGVFNEVTAARAAVSGAGSPAATAAASDVLSGALGKLFAVAEAYPELKASDNFRELQAELTDTEDKIAAAPPLLQLGRRRTTRGFRALALLVAGALGFRARVLRHGRGRRATPQVSF